MRNLIQDLRYALRQLRGSPAFRSPIAAAIRCPPHRSADIYDRCLNPVDSSAACQLRSSAASGQGRSHSGTSVRIEISLHELRVK